MVHPKLALEPVFRLALGSSHNTRVIYQNIERLTLAQKCLRSSANTLERIIVHLEQLDTAWFKEGFACFFSFFQIPDGEEDFPPCCREGLAGFWSDACGTASDDEDFIREFSDEAFILDYLKSCRASVAWAAEVGGFVGFGVAV